MAPLTVAPRLERARAVADATEWLEAGADVGTAVLQLLDLADGAAA